MVDQQQELWRQFDSFTFSERTEGPFCDVSNRQYLTPRWRDRGPHSSNAYIPIPSLDHENSPAQPRYLDIDDSAFFTSAAGSLPISRTDSLPTLPYLPMETETNSSSSPAVRLAPRYDHRIAFRC